MEQKQCQYDGNTVSSYVEPTSAKRDRDKAKQAEVVQRRKIQCITGV
ncbi:hypothetical protein JCM19235_849 [Vibrio maritimus]|uniref:Uncharacterized protein n=1 Tax=Vibrio maritimus TaxID=990268 RepID=A0A090RY97_9VIBR|nr:hypothetical protein JCM19235_849 [Vibrio maritimus]